MRLGAFLALATALAASASAAPRELAAPVAVKPAGHAVAPSELVPTMRVETKVTAETSYQGDTTAVGQLGVTATYDDAVTAGLTRRIEKDAQGNTSPRLEDALHREVKTTDALGRSAEVRFDARVRRETKDRRGFVSKYEYDAVDRLTLSTDFEAGGALKYTQSTSYQDVARTTTALDRRGIESVQHFDGLGRLEKTTRGAGALKQTELTLRDGAGNALEVTDANAHVTRAVFDGAGRMLTSTRGFGATEASTTRFKYDGVGNRLETKSARGGWAFDVLETYDDLNRAVRSEDALGNVTSRAFDEAGNKLCEKRPLGSNPLTTAVTGQSVAALRALACAGTYVTHSGYDETGALTSVKDALNGEWTYVYDSARNLVAKQDANLQLTTYQFDALNRRQAEHQQLGAQPGLTVAQRSTVPLHLSNPDLVANTGTLTWRRTYDESGNVKTTTDAKGQVTTSVWGILNRLASVDYTHASPRELPSLDGIDYSYDENGSVLDVTERKTTSTGAVVELTLRTYDGLDRLKTDTRYDGKLLEYAYDLKGNRTQVKDSSAVATDYEFDALDRLKTATFGGTTTSYSYWPDSLPQGNTQPNGVNEKRCYDNAGRLTALVTAKAAINDSCANPTAMLSRFDYGFDANGNRTSQLEQRTDVGTQVLSLPEATDYGFDADDRLVGVRYPDTGALYRLDAVGNRTGERHALASKITALTVAAFAAMAPVDLSHDITGVFNRADWLTGQSDAKDSGRNVALAYDPNGNVIQKATVANMRAFRWDCRDTLTSVLDNGVAVGRYDYDRNLQRVKRTAGAERVEYVLDDKYVLQEADGSQGSLPSTRRYHYAAQPLAVTSGGATSYLNVDALGSITDATSIIGAIATARQYDAWGQYRNGTAPTPLEPKLGFTGHQFDVESGLVYARARYYDPALGIFLSRDSNEGSLNDAPSLHRYAYVRQNPTRYIDPDGFCWALPGSGDTGCLKIGFAALQAKIASDYHQAKEFQATTAPGQLTAASATAGLFGAFVPLVAQAQRVSTSLAVVALGYGVGDDTVLDAEHTLNMLNPVYAVATHGKEGLEIDAQAKAEGGYTLNTAGELAVKAGEIGIDVATAVTLGRLAGAAARAPEKVIVEGAENGVTLEANAIRFSQSNVRPSLPEITASMKAKGWQGRPIDVVRMPDGALTAVDNTRLAAASLSRTPVQAVIRGFDDVFPATRAGGNLQGATWGEAIVSRISHQRPAWQRLYPSGSMFTGIHPLTPPFPP